MTRKESHPPGPRLSEAQRLRTARLALELIPVTGCHFVPAAAPGEPRSVYQSPTGSPRRSVCEFWLWSSSRPPLFHQLRLGGESRSRFPQLVLALHRPALQSLSCPFRAKPTISSGGGVSSGRRWGSLLCSHCSSCMPVSTEDSSRVSRSRSRTS